MKTNDLPKWNDIIFESRNKKFGAYELRTHYHSRLVNSMSITIFSILFLSSLYYFTHNSKSGLIQSIVPTDPVLFSDINVQQIKVEQPVIEKFPVVRNNPTETTYRPVSETIKPVETIIPKPSDVIETGPNESIHAGGNTANASLGNTNSTIPTSAISEPLSIASVTKQPQFPGGENSFINFLSKNIRYPRNEKTEGISGRVYVSFVINKMGELEAIKILRSPGPGFDEEVIRVLKLSPKWEPGEFQSERVSTIMNLPVNFKLEK